jgi:hypothetical protein
LAPVARGALLAALLSGACADAIEPPPPPLGFLTLWNRNSVSPDSPTFYEILELHVHDEASFSAARHASRLNAPLAIDATIAVRFRSGQYVTVVRRRNVGQNLALTTSEGLEIDSSCYVLEVFDETFRFLENEEVAAEALAAAGFRATCELLDTAGDGDSAGGD